MKTDLGEKEAVEHSSVKGQTVLLFQLDGKIHKALGDEVSLRWTGTPRKDLWDAPDRVYGSAIFEKTRPAIEQLKREFPQSIIGGTGFDVASTLEAVGIRTIRQDYSLYPDWRQSIGFTQRGCRLKCSFCVVPRKEGRIRAEQTIAELWRGDPWPRELILLDNDFFGQPEWRERLNEIREGGFKVSFNQGINARFLTDEAAEAIASVDYRDDIASFKHNLMKRKPGFNLHGEDEYKAYQDLILSEKGVECSVVITAHTISIRTESWADYYLAKSVVKPRTSLEIVRG